VKVAAPSAQGWQFSEAMRCWALTTALVASLVVFGAAEEHEKKKHHRRHHHKHHKTHEKITATGGIHEHAKEHAVEKLQGTHVKAQVSSSNHIEPKPTPVHAGSSEEDIISRMRALEGQLAAKEKVVQKSPPAKLEVNGPLPFDFADQFAKAVSKATGSRVADIKVLASNKVSGVPGDVREIQFVAPPKVVDAVQDQAADPDSKLANGQLHQFLVAKDDDDSTPEVNFQAQQAPEETPVKDEGIDIDTAMPYGELEPFGREDTAQELTEQSVKESDEMVDQLERAEVAEEKRAVFRALTRLRGAAITSFDGIARSQTGNIDEYNKLHKWRRTHPLHHLADEESDISKWAFPDNADF